VKKCQELERKALTIVLNFSKDGAPAPKKKHRCSTSRVQLSLANYWYLPHRKKSPKIRIAPENHQIATTERPPNRQQMEKN
jgi:hypothetical protein